MPMCAFAYEYQVHGFVPIPKADKCLTLKQFMTPKTEFCTWRLSKRRLRDQDGNFMSRGWLGRCVECNIKHIENYRKTNKKAMHKRHRIKQDEQEYLYGICRVQVNSLDIIAWPLFAALKKDSDNRMQFDMDEELRKIAVKVIMNICHVGTFLYH